MTSTSRHSRDLSAELSAIAHTLNTPVPPDRQLDMIVEVARHSMPEIDHVGISLAHADGRVETLAWTHDVVLELDGLQYKLGEGPCWHAIADGEPEVVVVEHARQEQRWPGFMPQAVALGLRSQLGLPLYVDVKARGVLNLYSVSSDVIDPETTHLAELFAVTAATALGRHRSEQSLGDALKSRTVIGLALGLLMERYGLDRAAAFAYLTRMASSAEEKVRVVAEQLVNDAESHRPE